MCMILQEPCVRDLSNRTSRLLNDINFTMDLLPWNRTLSYATKQVTKFGYKLSVA